MNLFVKNKYCLMQQKMQILYLNNHHDLEIKKKKIMEYLNRKQFLPGGPVKPGGPLGPCIPCFPGGPGGP